MESGQDQSSSQNTVVLGEADARRTVLVRAVEEADLKGVLLTEKLRDEASARARLEGQSKDNAADLLRVRSSELVERMAADHPVVARLLNLGLPSTVWIVVGGLVLGLMTNVIGASRQIHALANPLLILVLWNAVVLLGLGALSLLSASASTRARARDPLAGQAKVDSSPLLRGLSMLPLKGLRRAIAASEAKRIAEPLTRAAARAIEDWGRVSAPLQSARLRRCLHAGAIALTLGALMGMYARGLVLEYQVHWESTFMGESTAQGILDFALAPAATLGGIEVPRLAQLAATLETENAGGDTRAFLHLYALTVLLFVVIPRGVLVFLAGRRAARLADGLVLDTEALYYRRLLSSTRGGGIAIDIYPYSFTLSKERVEGLRSLLRDVIGGVAQIDVHQSLEYGAEASELAHGRRESGNGPLVVLFNLAQTPELELQGRFLEELRPLARGGLVALADCSAWRERVGSGPTFEDRLGEHRRSWERLLAQVGIVIQHIDLEAEVDAELVARLGAAFDGRVLGASSSQEDE